MELSSAREISGREGGGVTLCHVSLNLNMSHAGNTCSDLSVPELHGSVTFNLCWLNLSLFPYWYCWSITVEC